MDIEEAKNNIENISAMDLEVHGKKSFWWSNDHTLENVAYIRDLSSDYAKYKAENLKSLLLSKDENGEQSNLYNNNMSLSLNQMYFETLEYMFALYFAFLEAPNAIPVWLNLYRNEGLLSACKSMYELHQAQSGKFVDGISYNGVVKKILSLAGYRDEEKILENNRFTLIAGLSTIFAFSLKYYVKSVNHDTYNQIKHGHKARPNTALMEVTLPLPSKDINIEHLEFFPLIKSASGLNFTSASEIRRISGVREYGLKNVSMPVNNQKTLDRIYQSLTMIDFIIHCMKRNVGIDESDKHITVETPLSYQKTWLADDYEGVLTEYFEYSFSKESNTRFLKFHGALRENTFQNSGLFSFVNSNMYDLIFECTQKLVFKFRITIRKDGH